MSRRAMVTCPPGMGSGNRRVYGMAVECRRCHGTGRVAREAKARFVAPPRPEGATREKMPPPDRPYWHGRLGGPRR